MGITAISGLERDSTSSKDGSLFLCHRLQGTLRNTWPSM